MGRLRPLGPLVAPENVPAHERRDPGGPGAHPFLPYNTVTYGKTDLVRGFESCSCHQPSKSYHLDWENLSRNHLVLGRQNSQVKSLKSLNR